MSPGASQPGTPCRELLVTTHTKTPHQAHAFWEMKTFNIRRPWKYFLLPSLLVFFFHFTSPGLCRWSHHLLSFRNKKLRPVLPRIFETLGLGLLKVTHQSYSVHQATAERLHLSTCHWHYEANTTHRGFITYTSTKNVSWQKQFLGFWIFIAPMNCLAFFVLFLIIH